MKPVENSQVAETTPNLAVDFGQTAGIKLAAMKRTHKRPSESETRKTVRFEDEDMKIIGKIQEKYGMHSVNSISNVVRMALRRFAEAEGLKIA